MASLTKFELRAARRSGRQRAAPHQDTQRRLFFEKKAASGGELPEAALAAVRSRDATRRGGSGNLSQPKPFFIKRQLARGNGKFKQTGTNNDRPFKPEEEGW